MLKEFPRGRRPLHFLEDGCMDYLFGSYFHDGEVIVDALQFHVQTRCKQNQKEDKGLCRFCMGKNLWHLKPSDVEKVVEVDEKEFITLVLILLEARRES